MAVMITMGTNSFQIRRLILSPDSALTASLAAFKMCIAINAFMTTIAKLFAPLNPATPVASLNDTSAHIPNFDEHNSTVSTITNFLSIFHLKNWCKHKCIFTI